jgi:hypothetical protein
MKKKLVLIVIASLLVTIGLNGCTQKNNTKNQIDFINYTVTTSWWNKDHTQKYLKSGFYHNISLDVDNTTLMYLINGTIKNSEGKFVNTVHIGIILYDTDHNELGTTETDVFNLADTQIGTFSTDYFYNPVYFEKIDNASFTFSIP